MAKRYRNKTIIKKDRCSHQLTVCAVSPANNSLIQAKATEIVRPSCWQTEMKGAGCTAAREKQTDRQTDRDIERGKETARPAGRDRVRERDRQTDRQTERQTDRQTDRQRNRER